MTAARWSKLEEVFHAALERGPGERTRYLREACAGDEALEREARALLTGHENSESFIEPMRAQDIAGRRIGAYTLVRLIGAGGMGAVYEARQENPARAVALKVLRGALGSRGSVRRFEEEAAILARLRHSAIAQVYEAGTFDSGAGPTPFFAMELIEGALPITAFAREHTLPTPERLTLFLAVCDAVAHGHQRAVIHRDLKPANILVSADGNPKVIDFGVARTLGEPGRTMTQTLVGTLSYMSPEQCAGPTPNAPHPADVRSDVFSLGVVLFELLTDARPLDVDEKSLPEAARIIREQPPARPSSIAAHLRGDLETIILKALEKDPARRYQSVAELADDLQRYLTDRPILARPATMVYQARMFARRHRALVAAAATVAATLIAATAVSVSFGLKANQRAREAEAARAAQAAEAARARRISTFLEGALGSANPFVPSAAPPDLLASGYEPWADWRISPWPFAGKPGQAAGAVDLLHAAAARLDTDFADDPIAHARLADILGWTLYRLRDHAAEPLLRRSLELRGAALGPADADTMRSALHLAELLDATDRQTQSEDLYRSALDASRAAFGPMDPRTLRIERMLAHNLAYLQNRVPDAAALVEASLAPLGHAPADDQPALLEHQAYLAKLVALQQDWPRAIATARSSVQGLTRLAGPHDIRTGAALATLADVLIDSPGNADEAVEQALAAQRVQARWFGEQSLQWAWSRSLSAVALGKAARHAESGEAWGEAAAVYERLMGETDFETLRARGEQAGALVHARRDLARAEQLALSAAAGMDAVFATRSGYGFAYRAVAAQAAHEDARRERADQILESIIADLRTQQVPDWKPRLAGALRRSAAWKREGGDADAALALESEAAALEQKAP